MGGGSSTGHYQDDRKEAGAGGVGGGGAGNIHFSTRIPSMAVLGGGHRHEEDLLYIVLPVYYTSQALLPHEKEFVIKSWKQIVNARAPEFWRIKKEKGEEEPSKTPLEYFGHQFWTHFIDVHPACRALFTKGTSKLGVAFGRMISFLVSEMDDRDKLRNNLTTLINSHNKMGIKAAEYGIVGEVLFHTLKKTLGPEFDQATHAAWIKMYSRILEIVLPMVIPYEMSHKAEVREVKHKRMQEILGAHQHVVGREGVQSVDDLDGKVAAEGGEEGKQKADNTQPPVKAADESSVTDRHSNRQKDA